MNRPSTLMVGLGAVVALVLAAAPGALAAWSAPRALPVPAGALGTALAVDGRGDVAVAWSTSGRRVDHATGPARVGVAIRTPAGRVRSHLLWSRRREGASAVAVGIDRHGEVTVAWVARGRVHAAFGAAARRRWRAPRRVGPGVARPALAVAPDGEVLLAWIARNGGTHDAFAADVAWRRAGRPFGRVTQLHRPRIPAVDYSPDAAIPSFDAAGRAYLVNPCGHALRTAAPGRRRFAPSIAVAGGHVLGLSLSVAGAGRGLVSWVGGWCSRDATVGDEPGPAYVRTITGGRLGATEPLPSTAAATWTHAVAVAGRPSSAAWGEQGEQRSGIFRVDVTAGGVLGPLVAGPDGTVPALADGGGDVVVAPALPVPPLGADSGVVAVAPAGGGPSEAAPAVGSVAAATPGRRAAVLWSTQPPGATYVSVWRPVRPS
ncbi:MAG TPA: hypothetical protein VFT50_08070 [Baekduia sp.]|nr:hypothetical protein [Baekduia sp.]